MKVRSVKLTKEQQDLLRKTAAERGVTDSFMVREALDAYLGQSARPAGKRSAADAAAHLIGTLDGTPPDLSRNKRHLDGFGR